MSNISGSEQSASGGSEILCRRAKPNELAAATSLILGAGGKLATPAQVSDFFSFTRQRGIDISTMWVVTRSGQIAWATLPVVSLGRTMLLFVPTIVAGSIAAAATTLLDAVCEFYFQQGVHLAQVLIEPLEKHARKFFVANQFREIAELLYLQGVARPGSEPALGGGLRYLRYSAETHALFAQTILRTYQQSLDCPALTGMRDIEDVIAGHKATGEFDPALWTVLLRDDEPLGVLLLSRIAHSDSLELVYLGLTVPARGQGLGKRLLEEAMHRVVADGRRRLTLAVDAANQPALRLYYSLGLQRIAAKVALIRDLRPPAQVPLSKPPLTKPPRQNQKT